MQATPDVPGTNDWLSRAEQATLGTLRIAKRRSDWRLGRWTAKCAVAGYLSLRIAPSRIEIRAAESGAPEVLVDGAPASVSLSLSHSGDRALCAIAPAARRLGCDIEMVEPRSAAFVGDYFTPAEQALVANAPIGDRAWLVTLIWSAKESALKAMQEGLRLDTRTVAVTVARGAGSADWQSLAIDHRESGRRFTGWWRQDSGYVLTIVTWR